MTLSRRQFLNHAAGMVTTAAAGVAFAEVPASARTPLFLRDPDRNGIQLPEGFTSRVIARSLRPVGATAHPWHLAPDGGAVFTTKDGWTYVSNSEFLPGGAGAIEFDRRGRIVAARSLIGIPTLLNCAGGATPWGTWLSCEEWDYGRVIECDPSGRRPAEPRLALGQFAHEAVAADPIGQVLYLTEDKSDGCLYRFVPARWGDLSTGSLQVASVAADGSVSWSGLPNPTPTILDPPCRRQVPGATQFRGGEGIMYFDDHVFFTTKGDNRIWDLDVRAQRLSIRYDAATASDPQLTGVDNITATRDGSLWVAEDGGTMELLHVGPSGRTTPVLRIVGQPGSEITGPAFHPSERRLYVSSQRGSRGLGITYEIKGPFRSFAAAATSLGPAAGV